MCLCAPFLCSLARSARSALSLSLSLALALLTSLEVSRVLSLCVSSFCILFVFSFARALSLCLVRSLLSFLAVSRPHMFGSVARTSEMVSVRAHDRRAQQQANRRNIDLEILSCPEFDFIIHPPRSHYTETMHHPFSPSKKKM